MSAEAAKSTEQSSVTSRTKKMKAKSKKKLDSRVKNMKKKMKKDSAIAKLDSDCPIICLLRHGCENFEPKEGIDRDIFNSPPANNAKSSPFRLKCRSILKKATEALTLKNLKSHLNYVEDSLYKEQVKLLAIPNHKKRKSQHKLNDKKSITNGISEDNFPPFYFELCVFRLLESLVSKLGAPFARSLFGGFDEIEEKSNLFIVAAMLAINKSESELFDDEINAFVADKSELSTLLRRCTEYVPTVHPVLPYLIDKISTAEKNFKKLWKHLSGELFESESDRALHHLGFKCVGFLVPKLSQANVDVIFNQKFMINWVEAITLSKNSHHHLAKELSFELARNFVTLEDDVQQTILNKLSEPPGSIIFDNVTRSNVFKNLLSKAKRGTGVFWLNRLLESIKSAEKLDKNDEFRNGCAQMITAISRNKNVVEDEKVCINAIEFLIVQRFFNVFQDSPYAFAKQVTPNLKDVFQVAINHFLANTAKNSQILDKIVKRIRKLIKDETISLDSCDKFRQILGKKSQLFGQIEKDCESDQRKADVFKRFASALVIFALEDTSTAISIMVEVQECFNHSISEENDTNEHNWYDVFCDIILSLLSTATSSAFCNFLIAECVIVWTYISQNFLISKEIIEQCEAGLVMTGNEADSDDEEDEDEVEDLHASKKARVQYEGDDDEDEDDDDDDDDEDEKMDVSEEFRAKVREALGPAAIMGEDDGDLSMGDDEINRIDEALSALFKDRYTKNAKTKSMIHLFKTKICDLLEITLSSKSITPEIQLQIACMITRVIDKHHANSEDSLVVDRCVGIIRTLLNRSKKLHFDEEMLPDIELLSDCLHKTLKVAYHISRPNIQRSFGSLIHWIIRFSPRGDWYIDSVVRAVKDFITKASCHLSSDFFISIFDSTERMPQKLVDSLLPFINDKNVRSFKRQCAISLINRIISAKPGCASSLKKLENEEIQKLLSSKSSSKKKK